MMRKIGSEAARRRLPELLEQARAGEGTIILKRGVPYAALVSLGQCLESSGQGGLLALRGSGAGLWGESATKAVGACRCEWE